MRIPALAVLVVVSSVANAQSAAREELVYTGTPVIQVYALPEATREIQVDSADARKARLRIVKRGDRYFWASREDRELTMTVAGVYIIFSCSAGTIKLVNPAFDSVRAPNRSTTEKYDYVEMMHTQLGIVAYWGKGEGTAQRLQ